MSIVDIYYNIREKLGLAKQSDEKLKTARRLYPEKKAEDVVRKDDEKLLLRLGLLICALSLVCMLVLFSESKDSGSISEIERPSYGSAGTTTNVEVRTEDETFSLDISVDSRELTDEEKEEIFESAYKEISVLMLGKNESANRVSTSLDFSCEPTNSAIKASFQVSDYELIGYDGTLKFPEGFQDGITTTVKVILTLDDEERREYPTELVLYKPAEVAKDEKTLIEAAVEKENEDSAKADVLTLPTNVDGKEVSYFLTSSESSVIGVMLLGIVAIAFVIVRFRQARKELLETRNDELEIAYSELTSKLSVLIGAGLSLKSAWEKMVFDYKKSREEGAERSALYEEMDVTLRLINQGMTEEEAFLKFGDRIGLPPYLRLASILESSRKNGMADLRKYLSLEAREAFDKRLIYARRQGEKISTKLLVPMIILFGLIMMLLIIPALLSW